MARYKVVLAYDGTEFSGFQRQAKKTRTTQLVVEEALVIIGWRDKSILFAGRTDAGVHASGQVIAFDLDWRHSMEALSRAINSNLPQDVSVKKIEETDSKFHPRFDAGSRKYRYQIYCQPQRDPLRDRYELWVWPKPSIDRMQISSDFLIGSHDYSAFGSPIKKNGSTVREVFAANWEKDDDRMRFEISANAFLYHMVRRVVGFMIDVGQNKQEPESVKGYLDNKLSQPIQSLALPNGLSLIRVEYS